MSEHPAEPVVVVEGLAKRYGTVEAVRGVGFEVARGEVFALLGPNGAGKTSIVEMLEGFRARDAGEVRVLGLDPGRRAELAQLRQRVGVVLQESGGHYRFLSVRETLAMHASFHDHPRDLDEVLALTGIADVAHRRVRALSGGQQRRLDVAVALVGRPELLFLDEPTTGFDPVARRRAWELVASLRDLGTTVVLTTHYMEEAQHLADRVAVMRDGSVAGIGTPSELANTLRLQSVVRFVLPHGHGVDELPRQLPDAREHAGTVELHCEDATAVLAVLCEWALARGVQLQQLEVRPPSLEDTYFALTEGSL